MLWGISHQACCSAPEQLTSQTALLMSTHVRVFKGRGEQLLFQGGFFKCSNLSVSVGPVGQQGILQKLSLDLQWPLCMEQALLAGSLHTRQHKGNDGISDAELSALPYIWSRQYFHSVVYHFTRVMRRSRMLSFPAQTILAKEGIQLILSLPVQTEDLWIMERSNNNPGCHFKRTCMVLHCLILNQRKVN